MPAVKRCDWGAASEIMIKYHDTEWGVPLYDDQKLFEFLVLEGMQAGLSWLTVLKKREAFRKAFDGFDARRVACYGKVKVHVLLKDAAIIRNRLKIEAAINNAQRFLEVQVRYGSFAKFMWSIIGGEPIINRFKSMKELPPRTELSDRMSKILKGHGFRFVGPTICYAHMQATGMVNDHAIDCFRYKELTKHKKLA